jgi:3-oxoacyl-[acyl-carrier protein] reductase
MNLGLRDKVVMVAAASKGLGYGIAQTLVQEGAIVSLASRSAENVAKAVASLKESNTSRISGHTFDASDNASITQWATNTEEEFGRIDGLVVNAGGPPAGTFDSFDDAAWTRAYELTLLSAVRMIRAVLLQMRNQRSGSIVVVTSTSVKEPIDGLILSNVFRSGVASLVKSLSRELARDGIRINSLVPGRFDTQRVQQLDAVNAAKVGVASDEQRLLEEGRIPLKRYGLPTEFGAAAAFLLSEQASYMTGSTLVLDGGKTTSVS